jgi:hypothetical protein
MALNWAPRCFGERQPQHSKPSNQAQDPIMSDPMQEQDIRMDADDLWREDVFTDNRVGTIRRMTPISVDGDVDAARETRYIGSTQIMTPAGALPLSFDLPNESLAAAVDGFGEAAKEAVERTMEELKELQRQAASQIVVPKGGMDPGGLGGGMPGGGIQLP